MFINRRLKLKKKEEFDNLYEYNIERKLNKLKTLINCVEPVHGRDLPKHQFLPSGFLGRKLDREELGVDCDEVYPNIFVGDHGAAKTKQFLKIIGVTHIVNTADGNKFTQVQTGSHYYNDMNIKYMGLNVLDMPQSRISIHFLETADFIDKALENNGKVLVHCMVGFSRSATIVLAYLMIKKGMDLEKALITLRQKRSVRPNDGFLRQLIDLEYRLKGHNPSFII